MATLELTLTASYVRDWGVWEALRELLQNALDAQDNGYPMQVTHNARANTLSIHNAGAVLTRASLLLGMTSKADGGARGQFGEGYKLALLVLCRLGHTVRISTDGEVWTPKLAHSAAFDAPLLTVSTRRSRQPTTGVTITVVGITPDTWAQVRNQVLPLAATPPKAHDVGAGRLILTSPEHLGKLYARGLFVARLSDRYVFGYDLPDIRLDRDRKAPDTYSLRSGVAHALRRACGTCMSPEDILQLANTDCGEATALADEYRYSGPDAFTAALVEAFRAKHGPNTIPVTTPAECVEAEHFGLHGVIVSNALRVVLEAELGSFDRNKTQQALQVRQDVPQDTLTTTEQATLEWACALLAEADPTTHITPVQVVEFFGDRVLGTYGPTSGVRLARKVLADRALALRTLVHEFAHRDGADDGTVAHRDAMDSLYVKLVMRGEV